LSEKNTNAIFPTPLITTIIPTYRRPKLLQQAVRSVLNQTYSHFQVCIYDNASGDETVTVATEIAKEDPRVKYHCHPQNIGAIPNFNYGLKQVTTPFFSFLADDNTLLPHFFEDAINTLNRYPEAVFFAGQTILVNEKGQKIRATLDGWPPGLIFPPEGLLNIWEKGLPTWESVLFRKEVINSVGLLNPSVNGSADQDFIMRIARKHILYISKKPHALFLCHTNSQSVNRDLREVVFSHKKILEQWLQDGGLTEAVKERIRKRWEAFVKKTISSYLCVKCILGNDKETMTIASELMNKEISLSYKPLKALIIAKLANSNRFLKRLVSAFVSWYLQIKYALILLKNRNKNEAQKNSLHDRSAQNRRSGTATA